MRSALKALDEALARERARNARDLKAAEKAAAEAKAAAKAQAVQQAATEEIDALNAAQVGGRYDTCACSLEAHRQGHSRIILVLKMVL